jgi:hypothetical protein
MGFHEAEGKMLKQKLQSVRFRLQFRIAKRNFRRALARRGEVKALFWRKIYRLRYWYLVWKNRHILNAAKILPLLLIGISAFWIPELQKFLQSSFATEAQVASFRSFLLTIGGALIGSAAIVSSFVLFAGSGQAPTDLVVLYVLTNNLK